MSSGGRATGRAARILAHPVTVFLATMALLSLAAPLAGVPLSLITQIAIYTLYGAGVNLLMGYTGLVPFGASVFFGLASYAAALAMLRLVQNELAALLFAILVSLALGAVIGALILRRRGLYFSLLTLAFSQLAFEIAYKWTAFTGGENGLQDVPRPWLASGMAFHLFTVATVALGLVFLWRLAHAPFGRVLQAIRDNEQRARCLGYDSYRYKLAAFILAAGIIGYAGALLAFLLQGVYANNLSWQHAGDPLLMTILGGIHHFLGPLWGAIGFILLSDKLSAWVEQWWLLFAPIIIVFAIVAPEGLHGIGQRLFGRARWSLIRPGIPPLPAAIPAFESATLALDPDRPILTVRGLAKHFGSLIVAEAIDLEVRPYQLHSLIGPNGAGKTTFFNMLTGLLRPDAGSIRLGEEDITQWPPQARIRRGLSRSFQIISVFKNLTAFETVRVAVQARPAGAGRIRWLDLLWRDAHDRPEEAARTWSLLAAVGLAERAGEVCRNLSHGEQRLLEIAVALATDARLLLLDEPLAGLAEADRQVVATLIRRLARSHAVLLIEHDIDRVLELSDRITVLHQGRLIADGTPAEVAAHPQVIEAYLGKPASGAGRGEGAASPAAAAAPATPTLAVAVAATPLLSIERLSAGYDGSLILNGLSLEVGAGEVVAILGRNGVGKTTTLRAIMGAVAVQSGRVLLDGQDITGAKPYAINRLGIAMVPEGRRLFPNLTVWENLRLAARPGGASLDQVWALFPKLKLRQRARAENLSGGERQMAAIARALMAPSRLILLDEPFEGLAPAVVSEVMAAVARLREHASILLVEHNAELVLPLADRAYVLVNGQVAYAGSASALAADEALQARLLGITHETPARETDRAETATPAA